MPTSPLLLSQILAAATYTNETALCGHREVKRQNLPFGNDTTSPARPDSVADKAEPRTRHFPPLTGHVLFAVYQEANGIDSMLAPGSYRSMLQRQAGFWVDRRHNDNASLPSVGTDHRPHRKPQFWDYLSGSMNLEMVTLKGVSVTGGRLRLRLATLTGQITLSLVLLLTAGLFARATLRFRNTDPGFATGNRLFAPVFVPQPQFTAASGRVFYDHTLNRLRLLPGIRSAALTTRLPLYAAGMESSCVARDTDTSARASTMTVGAGYLPDAGDGVA